MFYSHDLLGRKTPLGAIWTLAHGRKLSKGRIISINLREICDEILQPGVPHSLRLQGILIGGLVLVFNKQQTYLLEDLQEMMKRLKAATDTGAAGDATKAEKGKGRGKGKGNKQTNNQASLEAITMMDMEDLMAPAAFGDEDILGLLAGGSLSDALASQGALPAGRGRVRGGAGELAGDLFEMPSLPGATTTTTSASEGGDTDAAHGGRNVSSKHTAGGSSKGTRTGSGRQHQQEEEVYGGLDMMNQDWLHPEDEIFADPDADLDLLGGMDLPLPPQAAAAGTTSDKSRDQTTTTNTNTTSHKPQTSGETTEAPATASGGAGAAGAAAAGGGAGGVPFEFDDQMFVMEEEELDEHHQQQQGDVDMGEAEGQRDQQQQRDQTGTQPAQVRRAKQRKRKGGQVVVDDLDNLVIRSKTYREWSTDSSPLINKELKSGRTLMRGPHTNNNTMMMVSSDGAGAGCGAVAGAPFTFGGGSGMLGGVPLCPELLALFKAPVEAAAAAQKATAGGGKGRGQQQQQPSSPEVNNSTGEGSLPGMGVSHAHKMPLDLHQPPREYMMEMMQDDDMNLMMAESPPHPGDEEQELQSNDEAHDRLGDLPFNGDIEIERMRGAATPGSDGSLQHMLPAGGGTTSAQQQRRGRDSNATSAGGSSLMGSRFRAGGSEHGGSGLKRRLGSADLGTTDDLDIFFGTGNLADMLPDIQADDFYDDLQQHQPGDNDVMGSEGAAAAAGGRSGGGRAGSVPAGADSNELTPYNSSQFPLLEETEPDQATQLPSDQAALSKMTRVALSIFQERLERSSEQQLADAAAANGAGAGADGGGDNNAVEPSVSFFGLIKEGRLSRNQAATLFYQVCVTTTAGFVSAEQTSAYGDITIKQGSRGV